MQGEGNTHILGPIHVDGSAQRVGYAQELFEGCEVQYASAPAHCPLEVLHVHDRALHVPFHENKRKAHSIAEGCASSTLPSVAGKWSATPVYSSFGECTHFPGMMSEVAKQ
jgi:hypothetical protein